eukprot:544640-Alexandrium_andersonii.AAC.1
MSASLVGSEMCIRDRFFPALRRRGRPGAGAPALAVGEGLGAYHPGPSPGTAELGEAPLPEEDTL